VSYSDNPGQEPAIVTIPSFTKTLDDFNKSLLEEVFCKGLVFYGKKYIGIYFGPVPVN